MSAAIEVAPDARPNLRWMLSHPWHVLALAAGAGLPARAPGTWGTLAAWVSFLLIDPILTGARWASVIALGLYFGAWAAQHAGRALGQADSSHIVIDEVIAFWIVLAMLPASTRPFVWQLAAFVLFRFFDIVKPPPIRALEARFKNGLGVMLDDLVAAFFTLLVIALAVRVAA